MKKQNIYTVRKKRRREGRTNYKKRLVLIYSNRTRAVIRKSLKNLTVQFVDFYPEGDLVKTTTSSVELRKYGWDASTGNISAAYLTGLLAGKKAAEKGVKEAVMDLGNYASVKGSRIYSAIKGIVDSGIKINCDPSMFPIQDRIQGKHVIDYFKSINKEAKIDFEKVKRTISDSK